MATRLPHFEDRRQALPPPKFGLGSLFAAIAVLGGLFAIVHYFGSYGAAIGLLVLLCVLAHVAGNALGTQLRSFGDVPLREDGSAAPVNAILKPSPTDYAPATRLRQRRSLGKWILVVTGLGIVASGLLGYWGIMQFVKRPEEWRVVVIGVAACSVLGGIWTFAAASFLKVTCGEFLHARRESRLP